MPEITHGTSGQILEKVTRSRIINEDEEKIEYWKYIEKLNLPDGKHLLYLYLVRDNKGIPYGQYTSHISMRDGKLIPIHDKEAFEQGLQSRFGGGIWRLILKNGTSRVCEGRVFTGEAPTLPPPPPDSIEYGALTAANRPAGQFSQFNQLPYAPDGATQIANKAIDALTGQEHQAVNLGLNMMATAAETMKRFADRSAEPAPPAGPVADLQAALLQATIARLTAPPPDPMAQFTTMLAMMREASSVLSGGANATNPREQVREWIQFAREFIVPTNGNGDSSTGTEVVRTVAAVVPQAIDGFRAVSENYRAGKEAERDTVFMMQQPAPMQGRPAGAPGQPMPPAAAVLPVPRPNAPPIGSTQIMPGPGGAIAPNREYIEQQVMKLFNAAMPAEEAASRALEFLNVSSGDTPATQWADLLAMGGETELLNMFRSRPILAPATLAQNMPRLMQFIRAFLKFHAQDQGELDNGGETPKPN